AGALPAIRLEALKFAIVEHLAGRAASDDVTLALLDCGAEFRLAGSCVPALDQAMTVSQRMPELGGAWEMSLIVDASRLKHLDMLPVLQEFVSRIDPQWAQGEAAFTHLAESYGQALEQGLLKLEAGLKARPEGLSAYALARDRKLQDLQAEAVRITLARGLAGQPLQIRMDETSPGIDPESGADGAAAASFANSQASDFPQNYGGMDVATARLGTLKAH
ncbi:MAG TPA: hypothetical protein VH105_21335, partial [Burkholderiales bacterium]|nr:hypothetical protein [Burkholderiales bacterium]